MIVITYSCVMKVAEGVVDSRDLIIPVAEFVKKAFGRQLESRPRRDERCRQCMKTLGSMSTRSTGSSNGPPTNISDNDDKKKRRTYSTNESEVLRRLSQYELLVEDEILKGTKQTGEGMKTLLYAPGVE